MPRLLTAITDLPQVRPELKSFFSIGWSASCQTTVSIGMTSRLRAVHPIAAAQLPCSLLFDGVLSVAASTSTLQIGLRV